MDVMKFNLGQKFNLEKKPNYSSYILFTRANKDCFYAHQKKKSRNLSFGFSSVLKTGLEPVRPNGHWILSPTCLPIPPLQHKT